MPRCFVERCHNYGGRRLNIILHSFPNNLEKIKLWLRSIEESGHVIRDMEELAQRIYEGKTNNRFRVCSEHFTQQSYQPSGLRKTLRKDAVPTIFRDVPPQKCPWQKVKPALKNTILETPTPREPNRGTFLLQQRYNVFDPLLRNPSLLRHHHGGRANVEKSSRAAEYFRHKESRQGYGAGGKRTDVTHVILKLTLEIICLLTGEDYIVVKKTSAHGERWSRTPSNIMEPPPPSLIHTKTNQKKILELTRRMMELLTGKNCEYGEDHHRGIRMDHGALASLDDMVNGLSNPTSGHIVEESSCEEKEEIYSPADHGGRYLFSNIKVEAVSYDGRNISDPNTYPSTDDARHHPPTPVKEEPMSCDEGTFLDSELPADDTQQPPSPHVKEEEPVSCEDDNLTDPGDCPQQSPSPIKDEPITCEAVNPTDSDVYIPPDYTARSSPASMEEPGGNLMDHAQHDPSNVMAESALCDEGTAINPDLYSEAHPSTQFEGETEDALDNYSLFDKGNLDTDIYALIKHAQAKYTFTRIQDGSSSEEDENPQDKDPQTPGDHNRPCPPNSSGEAAVPQTFQCRDCSECFTRKSALINHRRNHRQEKLTCPKCGKVISKRSSLQNHLTLHTGEKPYACPVCGKCFARKSNLISHETIHSGKASFICAECGRYFVCKVHLTKHQIIHEK